jgi:hypothetical protein
VRRIVRVAESPLGISEVEGAKVLTSFTSTVEGTSFSQKQSSTHDGQFVGFVRRPVPLSAERGTPSRCMNKRANRLKCRHRIVIEQKMCCGRNFDHVNVAMAKPREVGKRLILLAVQKELWHP